MYSSESTASFPGSTQHPAQPGSAGNSVDEGSQSPYMVRTVRTHAHMVVRPCIEGQPGAVNQQELHRGGVPPCGGRTEAHCLRPELLRPVSQAGDAQLEVAEIPTKEEAASRERKENPFSVILEKDPVRETRLLTNSDSTAFPSGNEGQIRHLLERVRDAWA